MPLTAIGLVIGLAIAAALTRLVSSLLYGVSPGDPITFAAIAMLLAAVALIACGVPAWRAARIEPMAALRHE